LTGAPSRGSALCKPAIQTSAPDRCSTESRDLNEQSYELEHVAVPDNSTTLPHGQGSCIPFESCIPKIANITPSILLTPLSVTHNGQRAAGIGFEHYRQEEILSVYQRARNKESRGDTIEMDQSLATHEKERSELLSDHNHPGKYPVTIKSRDPDEEHTYACLFFMNNPNRWKHVESCRNRFSLSRLRSVHSLLYREHLNVCLPKVDAI
jgi:hypothetical protein